MKTPPTGITRVLKEAGLRVGRGGAVAVARSDDEHVRVTALHGTRVLGYATDVLSIFGYTVRPGRVGDFYIIVTKEN